MWIWLHPLRRALRRTVKTMGPLVLEAGDWRRRNGPAFPTAMLLVGISAVLGVAWFAAGASEAAALAQVISLAAMAVTAIYAKRAIEASVTANRVTTMPYILSTVSGDDRAGYITVSFSNIREAPAFGLRLKVLLEYHDRSLSVERVNAALIPINERAEWALDDLEDLLVSPDSDGLYCASGRKWIDILTSGQQDGWHKQPVPKLPMGVRTHAVYFDAFGTKYEQFSRFEWQGDGSYATSRLIPVAPLAVEPEELMSETVWFDQHALMGVSLTDFEDEKCARSPARSWIAVGQTASSATMYHFARTKERRSPC